MKFFREKDPNKVSLFSVVKSNIGLREICVFGGWGTITYGLYQYIPWVGLTASGTILMFIGLICLDGGKN